MNHDHDVKIVSESWTGIELGSQSKRLRYFKVTSGIVIITCYWLLHNKSLTETNQTQWIFSLLECTNSMLISKALTEVFSSVENVRTEKTTFSCFIIPSKREKTTNPEQNFHYFLSRSQMKRFEIE